MKKKWMFAVLIIFLIFSITIFYLQRRITKGIEVKTASIAKGELVAYFSTSGTVESIDKKDYYPQGTAKVVKVYVKVGDRVKNGDTLVEFEVPNLSIQLKTAQIQYSSAKIQLDNLEQQKDTLSKAPQQGVSQTGVLQSSESIDNQIKIQKNQVEIARLNVESIKQNINKQQKYIKSDLDGVVTALNAQNGGMTSLQLPVVSVENIDNLRAVVNVNQYDITKIRKGQDAVIKFNDKNFSGSIDTIYPVAVKTMSASGTDTVIKVNIKILDNDGTLKSGFDVDVDVKLGGKSKVLKLPSEAVITDKEGNERVFIVEKGTARLKNIKTGLSSNVEVEVTSGLNEGDRVILNPPAAIKEGVKVADKGIK